MPDQDLAADLAQAQEKIEVLFRRINVLERKLEGIESIPYTHLLSKSRTVRSLAVVVHAFLGGLVISIIVLVVREIMTW